MGRLILCAAAFVLCAAAPASGCEAATGPGSLAALTVRVGDEAWNLPAACDDALADLAARVLRERRKVVRIDALAAAGGLSSMSLARLAAITRRAETALLERGLPRHRVRISEFRVPTLESSASERESRIIIRIDDR